MEKSGLGMMLLMLGMVVPLGEERSIMSLAYQNMFLMQC